MPKIVVVIEWDTPDDVNWLNPDNVALALHAYCENTHFTVHSTSDEAVQEGDSNEPIQIEVKTKEQCLVKGDF